MSRGSLQRAGTQRERILNWALTGRVVHQDDWYNGGADGGSPIKAVRSRISEIEADGYGFHHFRRADGTTEYRLAYVPPRQETGAELQATPPADRMVAGGGEPGRLFEPPAAPALNAALADYEDEAA